MQKTKVSGCIVAYNGYDEVANGIKTITSATKGVDFSLYVVDNNSPDGTGTKLCQTDFGQNVTCISLEKNAGFGVGHNSVLKLLNSEYHAVINPDITLDTDAITALCAWLDENQNVVMATPRLMFPGGEEQYTAKRVPTFMALLSRQLPFTQAVPFLRNIEKRYLMLDEDLSKPQKIDFCTGCFFVIRTEVFKKIGGFDENYFMYVEDADLTREVQKHGEVMYVPNTRVIHAWHRDTRKKFKNFSMQISSMLKYWHKWGFRFYKH